LPAAHRLQTAELVAPRAALKVPAAQATHAEELAAPVAVPYVLGGHCSHAPASPDAVL
jgi:hypothetical protein